MRHYPKFTGNDAFLIFQYIAVLGFTVIAPEVI